MHQYPCISLTNNRCELTTGNREPHVLYLPRKKLPRERGGTSGGWTFARRFDLPAAFRVSLSSLIAVYPAPH